MDGLEHQSENENSTGERIRSACPVLNRYTTGDPRAANDVLVIPRPNGARARPPPTRATLNSMSQPRPRRRLLDSKSGWNAAGGLSPFSIAWSETWPGPRNWPRTPSVGCPGSPWPRKNTRTSAADSTARQRVRGRRQGSSRTCFNAGSIASISAAETTPILVCSLSFEIART